MPIEVTELEDAPIPIPFCPRCGRTFRPFMRGEVHRSAISIAGLYHRITGKRFRHCALICSDCKWIVGYE
jgi:hypothetical protein